MTRDHWLMKTEPREYAITDLENSPGGVDHWDGVRNYQARNFMRDDMQVGDPVLIYHSGRNPAVVGTAEIARSGYPDHTAWDPTSGHYDPRSTPENPVWFMVDVRFRSRFHSPLPLSALRQIEALADMMLLRRGMRLSIQPVTAREYTVILELARQSDR
jgi:predicted RNA-binding protein with PUA-like domain